MAAIAFVAACVAHEAVGHGLACLGTGGTVRLLSSVYFRCQPGHPFVDAAGPLNNLCVAAVFAVAAHRSRHATARTAFALVAAFDGLWGAGYLIFSAITNTGDLAFVVRDLGLRPAWAWRLGMGLAGLWLYGIVVRSVAPFLPKGMPLLAAYCVAGGVACISVLFYPGRCCPRSRTPRRKACSRRRACSSSRSPGVRLRSCLRHPAGPSCSPARSSCSPFG